MLGNIGEMSWSQSCFRKESEIARARLKKGISRRAEEKNRSLHTVNEDFFLTSNEEIAFLRGALGE